MTTHDARSDSYIARDATGRVTGGAATDVTGQWTYWRVADGARRVRCGSRGEATRAIG